MYILIKLLSTIISYKRLCEVLKAAELTEGKSNGVAKGCDKEAKLLINVYEVTATQDEQVLQTCCTTVHLQLTILYMENSVKRAHVMFLPIKIN